MAAVLDLVRSRMGGLQHEHCISRISGSTGVWESVNLRLLYFLLLFLPVNILAENHQIGQKTRSDTDLKSTGYQTE
jgi:hypothetical protein